MFRKLVYLCIIVIMLFSLVACVSEDKKILKEFDLSDPKIIWAGSIEDDFADNAVVVTMRKTTTFPELKLEHFKLDNVESLEYISLRPTESYVKDGGDISEFRQIAIIYLKESGKEKVAEAIRQLEELEFVKCAGPSVFLHPD